MIRKGLEVGTPRRCIIHCVRRKLLFAFFLSLRRDGAVAVKNLSLKSTEALPITAYCEVGLGIVQLSL